MCEPELIISFCQFRIIYSARKETQSFEYNRFNDAFVKILIKILDWHVRRCCKNVLRVSFWLDQLARVKFSRFLSISSANEYLARIQFHRRGF